MVPDRCVPTCKFDLTCCVYVCSLRTITHDRDTGVVYMLAPMYPFAY